jgi:ribosomal protein S18 acetylase RimI-like enzyme
MKLLAAITKPFLKEYWVGRVYGIATRNCNEPLFPDFKVELLQDINELRASPDVHIRNHANNEAPGARCYVVRDGRTVAGMCWVWHGESYRTMRNYLPLRATDSKIVELNVHASYRGKGIAPRLIAYSVCRMREDGFKRMFARVYHSNQSSARAFEKVGFKAVAKEMMIRPRFAARDFRWLSPANGMDSID